MSDNDQGARDEQSEANKLKADADAIDENDPHKVEKLANLGKDTDVAEETE